MIHQSSTCLSSTEQARRQHCDPQQRKPPGGLKLPPLPLPALLLLLLLVLLLLLLPQLLLLLILLLLLLQLLLPVIPLLLLLLLLRRLLLLLLPTLARFCSQMVLTGPAQWSSISLLSPRYLTNEGCPAVKAFKTGGRHIRPHQDKGQRRRTIKRGMCTMPTVWAYEHENNPATKENREAQKLV